MTINEKTYYSTAQVAVLAGVSRDTLLRWLKEGKIAEPGRDRNRWRAFTEQEKNAVLRYAQKYTPSPGRQQTRLFKQETTR